MRNLYTGALSVATLILCAVAACFLCVGIANAAPIPADVSGTYVGAGSYVSPSVGGVVDGWTCDLRAYQTTAPNGDTGRSLSAVCWTPAGTLSGAATAADACPTENTQPPLVGSAANCGPSGYACAPPGTTKLSITGYSAATAQCSLGEVSVQLTVVGPNGYAAPGIPYGIVSRMCRTQIVASPAPYSGCASPPPKIKPRRFCAGAGRDCL